MEQLASQSSHGQLRHAAVAGRAPRGWRLTRGLPFFLFVAALLCCVFAPSLEAQSGRRRPEPAASPEPNAQQRPRRAAPRPGDHTPGQPATPDAPSTTVSQPTPTPAAPPRPQPTDTAASPAAEAVEVDDGEIVRVTSNLVPVSATVTDTRGKAVTDLSVDDFELRVDGQPKPIGGLSHAETPVRIVMLFDNSKSVHASREFEKQAAIRFFKNVLRPVDQAAIYSVETVYSLEQTFTNDVSKLVRTIENFPDPDGATKLLDAMAHAAEYLRIVPGRKVIVIVSDGTDTVSELSFDETLRRVLAADCQVYAVQTGVFESANLTDLMAMRRLETFSDRTGGSVYVPKTTGELDSAFAQIAADLSQQYVLSYYPTDDGRDGRFRVINLRVKTRPNLRVRARRGYYPRVNPQQLSALPDRFTSTTDTSANASDAPAADPPLTLPARESARNSRSTIMFGGPAHGSKNMNPETSGDAPARVAADVRVVAASKQTAPTPEPKVEPRAETRSVTQREESPPATDAAPRPAPDASPTPVAALTERAPTTPSNGPASTSAPKPSPSPTPTAAASNEPARRSTSTQPSTQTPSSPPQAGQQTTQNSPPLSVNVGHLNSRAVSLPRPIYPQAAQRMRVEGAVRVLVLIDENGKVISTRAENGHTLLREAAVAAARLARFAPTLVSGQPVRVSGFITYNFKL